MTADADNSETGSTLGEGTSPAEAKPARRKRAAKPAVTAEAPVDADVAGAAPAALPATAASESLSPALGTVVDGDVPRSAPAKRTRRAKAAAEAPASGVVVESMPAAEPAPLPAPDADVPQPSREAAAQASDAGAQSVDANGNAEPEAAAASGDVATDVGGAESGGRGRRRRNKDRAPRAEREASSGEGAGPRPVAQGGAEDDDEALEGADAAPRPAPADPNEVFASVVSGEFDVGTEELPEPPPPHKRVLLPEPDAPKLQKVLAQSGIGSRRDMEALIQEGQVTVNGEPAHVGQRISFGDRIQVRGKPVRVRIIPPAPRIIAYHKPVGEVVTHDDPQQRPTVFRRLPRLPQGKWQSVGRLDLNTEGLLLFTNSGELANQLMHPRFGVEREYAVRVLGKLDEADRAQLLEGVNIDGQTASFRSIEDGGGEGANHWYRVVITEGRNREVRKLFDAVELTVSRLIRIRYGTVVLPRGLKRGHWVDLDAVDVRAIRQLAGGPKQEQARQAHAPQQGGKAQGQGQAQDRGRNKARGPDRPNQDRPARGPQQGGPRPGPRPPQDLPMAADRQRDDDLDDDFDPARIPNPLEQTFDKRFVQNPRSPAGGRGFGRGGGGFGAGGSAPPPGAPRKPGAPREPDPLQTSVGYIGADAFHRKIRGGGGGGFGGNRNGGGGGGGGGGKRRGR